MPNELNNFMIADGEEAKVLSEQTNTVGEKIEYLRLKAGESVKVILLDPKFPNYYCHSDFSAKIPSHVCTAPRPGMKCVSCDAGIKRSMKYIVPLYDIDKKKVIIWDAPKSHVVCIYANIDAYEDEITDEVFTLKRTGSTAQDTSYSFIALPPKQKANITIPEDAKPFVGGSQERSDFYNNILKAPTPDYLAKILNKGLANEGVVPVENNGSQHGF